MLKELMFCIFSKKIWFINSLDKLFLGTDKVRIRYGC